MSWPPDADRMTRMADDITVAAVHMRATGITWLQALAAWINTYARDLGDATAWTRLECPADTQAAHRVAVEYLTENSLPVRGN